MDNSEVTKMAHVPDERTDSAGSRGTDPNKLSPDLERVARRYAAQPIPRPAPEQTAQLVGWILAEASASAPCMRDTAPSVWQTMRVARWRMRLLGPVFWSASAFLLALAAAASLATSSQGNAAVLILIVPLAGILGLAYALRTVSTGLREVEAAAPVGAVEVMAGLALAIIGYDCAFGVLLTVLLALLRWAPFVSLLAAWLGPLLFLSGLSLPLALRWGTGVALTVGAAPWAALAVVAVLWGRGFPATLFALPLSQPALVLHMLAALLGAGVLVLLCLRGSRWQRYLVVTAFHTAA